jgi:hypothetical protein
MLTQTQVQIYLSGQRTITRSDGVCSLRTFNCADGGSRFGALLTFEEQRIEAGKSLEISTEKPIVIVLIPMAGGLELIDSPGASVFVGIGELYRMLVILESKNRIRNPYPSETIRFLQICFDPGISGGDFIEPPLRAFSLDREGVLLPIFERSSGAFSGFIGRYGGRHVGEFTPAAPDKGLFCYIIQGAFEVQDRLLEKGDALALQHVATLAFEALSHGAIILVLEV